MSVVIVALQPTSLTRWNQSLGNMPTPPQHVGTSVSTRLKKPVRPIYEGFHKGGRAAEGRLLLWMGLADFSHVWRHACSNVSRHVGSNVLGTCGQVAKTLVPTPQLDNLLCNPYSRHLLVNLGLWFFILSRLLFFCKRCSTILVVGYRGRIIKVSWTDLGQGGSF